MSTKNWKNQELKSLLTEKWVFKMDLSKLNEELGDGEIDKDDDEKAGIKGADPENVGRGDVAAEAGVRGDKDEPEELEEAEEVFAPNHYCVHHGGVQREGKVEMAEAVNHNYDEELGKVTHYDMQFEDGTIMENVPFEDIQVTNASLAEVHHKHKTKKKNKTKKKK